MRRRCFRPMSRWLLSLLAVLVVLGHACEWTGAADLVASPALLAGHHANGDQRQHDGATDHHANDHGDGLGVSCDPVAVAVNSGVAVASAGTEAAVVSPVATPSSTVARFAVTSDSPADHVPRPPLFLLHASL